MTMRTPRSLAYQGPAAGTSLSSTRWASRRRLSSNLVFANDENLADMVVPSGQEAALAASGLAKSAVVTVEGERIGIVGATSPGPGGPNGRRRKLLPAGQ